MRFRKACNCTLLLFTPQGRSKQPRFHALPVHLRVSGPSEKLALSGTAQELVPFHDDAASGKNNVGHARHLNAFEHRVIHSHVVSLGADGVFALRIENHEISIAADRDGSLARVQAKEFCRGCGNQFNKSIHTETSLGYAAGVNQAHAMLNARTAVRYLGEVVASEFFLFLETKWTVIGGDDLQMIPLETVPEFFLMPFFPKRRGKDVLRAFEIRDVKVFDREIQILWASLGIDRKAAVARLPNFLKSLMAA